MHTKKHVISGVKPDSIAMELELEPGDELISINGKEIEDVFDYQFLTEDEYLLVVVRKNNGEEWELEIEKDYDEDLGIEFENGLMDDYRSCSNKCIFCFIDQMPKGMRETLYFKDDDSRLSFLQGNYVTLTNMSDKDVERVIKYHMSPINISFQTTNPELRCMMLHNRFAGDALKKVDRFYEAGIEMNGQIVLCKGVNDGAELERSISDMSKYLPHLRSVSVVPVGLSKYREGLYPLEPFTKEEEEMFSGTLKDGKKETSAVETADPEVISEKPAESTSPEINNEPIKSLEQETPKQLELFEERLLAPESRSRHRLIGQLFDTYWLVQFEDNFYIIDQHAAHEKVYYERFVKLFQSQNIQSQYVSPPLIVSLSLEEENLLKANEKYFRDFGFEIEPFGGREYSISAVPSSLLGMTEEELFLEMLDHLTADGSKDAFELFTARLATMACKAAVKGNHSMSPQEADKLIDELLTLENPYNCPHGRPTIIAMSKTEIEKKFKRIV